MVPGGRLVLLLSSDGVMTCWIGPALVLVTGAGLVFFSCLADIHGSCIRLMLGRFLDDRCRR